MRGDARPNRSAAQVYAGRQGEKAMAEHIVGSGGRTRSSEGGRAQIRGKSRIERLRPWSGFLPLI